MLLKKRMLSLLAMGIILFPTVCNANDFEALSSQNTKQSITSSDRSEKARDFVKNDGNIVTLKSFNPDLINTTDIQLDMLIVNVDKNINDITVEHNKTEDYVEAIIKDKNTGEVLDTYREIFEQEKPGTRSNIIYRTLERDYPVKPAIVKTTCRAEIWTSGSFRQINKKPTNVSSVPGNSGNYVLQDRGAYITTSKYPATSVACNINGNVVITTTSSTSGSWSISALESLGFSVSHSTGSTYHARKWYNSTISFRI